MAKCRDCSYEPADRPKVFCPACGSMWKKAKPSKDPSRTKLGETSTNKTATVRAPKKTTKKAAPKKGK
jgi:hypothetical protein